MEWQGRPYLCLIDLQQHRPCSEAAVIEQHVGQDGQLGEGALQGPGVGLQGLLPGVRGQSQRDRGRGSKREREYERKREDGWWHVSKIDQEAQVLICETSHCLIGYSLGSFPFFLYARWSERLPS